MFDLKLQQNRKNINGFVGGKGIVEYDYPENAGEYKITQFAGKENHITFLQSS